MYKAKIKTDAGKTIHFSYEHGVIFDIYPLSGTDVTVSASQGYNQIGQTVTGQSVGGIRRTISGVLLSKNAAKNMLSSLPVFTTGRLILNDTYFCNITVQKTPEIYTGKNGKTIFTMQVFCDTPFWLRVKQTAYVMNSFTKLFSFPVMYNSHMFGAKEANSYIDIKNDGDVATPYTMQMTSSGAAENYGIVDIVTGEVLRFNDTLTAGETVVFERRGGRVTAVKTNGDESHSIVSAITDDSTMFDLKVGSNFIRVIADSGEDTLSASITFYPAFMGVLV